MSKTDEDARKHLAQFNEDARKLASIPTMTAPTPEQMREIAHRLEANETGEYVITDDAIRESAAALRAAADQLEAVQEALAGGSVATPAVVRLRAALVESRAASDRYSQALSECREQMVLNDGRLRAQLDALRVVIENAPHEEGCDHDTGYQGGHCNCWKADAL